MRGGELVRSNFRSRTLTFVYIENVLQLLKCERACYGRGPERTLVIDWKGICASYTRDRGEA